LHRRRFVGRAQGRSIQAKEMVKNGVIFLDRSYGLPVKGDRQRLAGLQGGSAQFPGDQADLSR